MGYHWSDRENIVKVMGSPFGLEKNECLERQEEQ